MAAALIARARGRALDADRRGGRDLRAVEHRLEFVREIDGVDYYNDSKATSVDATLKAIDAFPGGLWVILGGKDKGSDYTVLREPLRAKARAALLIGAAAPQDRGAARRGAVPLVQCGTLAAAVDQASRSAAPGDTVLLAPACASFDQFESFEHRGRVFKELVNALAEGADNGATLENRLDPVRHHRRHGLLRPGDGLQRVLGSMAQLQPAASTPAFTTPGTSWSGPWSRSSR